MTISSVPSDNPLLPGRAVLRFFLFLSQCSGADELRQQLSQAAGCPAGLFSAPPSKIAEYFISDPQTAVLFHLIASLSEEGCSAAEPPREISSPAGAVANFMRYFFGKNKEETVIAAVDASNRLLGGLKALSCGNCFGTVASVRDIVKFALRSEAKGIYIAHNHPTDLTEPSTEDVLATRDLSIALRSVGIELMDHIIIGRNTYCSMRSFMRYESFFGELTVKS